MLLSDGLGIQSPLGRFCCIQYFQSLLRELKALSLARGRSISVGWQHRESMRILQTIASMGEIRRSGQAAWAQDSGESLGALLKQPSCVSQLIYLARFGNTNARFQSGQSKFCAIRGWNNLWGESAGARKLGAVRQANVPPQHIPLSRRLADQTDGEQEKDYGRMKKSQPACAPLRYLGSVYLEPSFCTISSDFVTC